MESTGNLRKMKFALEWFKTGNATEAARLVGYKAPEKAAQRLKSDPYVGEQLAIVRDMFELRNVAKDDIDDVKKKIASIEEVLAALTSVLRREDPETENRDILRAAEVLLKYFTTANLAKDDKESGVVILPGCMGEQQAMLATSPGVNNK